LEKLGDGLPLLAQSVYMLAIQPNIIILKIVLFNVSHLNSITDLDSS
jgi:hypothetical protein